MTEYKQLSTQSLDDSMFTAGPVNEDNLFEWEALIQGPDETPFVGTVVDLDDYLYIISTGRWCIRC